MAVSVYRRPLRVANLRFLSAAIWDSREVGAARRRIRELAREAS